MPYTTHLSVTTHQNEFGEASHITISNDTGEGDYSSVEITMVGCLSTRYQYRSRREGDRTFVTAPDLMPLNLAWHHALVFLGVVPPDNISHPAV